MARLNATGRTHARPPGESAKGSTEVELCDDGRHVCAPCRACLHDTPLEPSAWQCFNKVIASFGRARLAEVAEEWLGRMQAAGLSPNLVSYSTVIAAYARTAQPDDALRVLREMQRVAITPDVVTYNAVIDAHARAGRLHQANALLRKLERGEAGDGCVADVVSYTIVISGFARRGKLQEASRTLQRMQMNTSIVPDAPCFNVLIGSYAAKGMWGAVSRSLAQMRSAGVHADAYTYGPLLEACRKSGQRNRARAFGRAMLLDKQLPLSPFCVISLRKAVGATQLKALAQSCEVPWSEVEAVLAKSDDGEKGKKGGEGRRAFVRARSRVRGGDV